MIAVVRKIIDATNRRAWLIVPAGLLLLGLRAWRLRQNDAARAGRPAVELPALARKPKVSVLVAAWNEREQIDMHLQSFLLLDYPQIELILCAGGSDGTFERANRYASERIIVLPQYPREGKQRALARCLEHASGEIIYLTDADCIFSDEALCRLLAVLVNEQESAATGGFVPTAPLRKHPFVVNQWAVDSYARAQHGTYVEGLIGRNAAVTRVALESSQALNEHVPIGTDYHLARSLIAQGQRIRYVRESVVATDYHTQLRPYIRQQTRWLRNIVVHGWRFGAYREAAAVLRSCAIGIGACALPCLVLFIGPLALALWLVLLGAVGLNRVRYLHFLQASGQTVPLAAYLLSPFYAALDLWMLSSAGVDILLRRRDRW